MTFTRDIYSIKALKQVASTIHHKIVTLIHTLSATRPVDTDNCRVNILIMIAEHLRAEELLECYTLHILCIPGAYCGGIRRNGKYFGK